MGSATALLVIGGCPVVSQQLDYSSVKRAVLQHIDQAPEKHHPCFRLQEQEQEQDAEQIFKLLVLEQFVARLPTRTAELVRCHWSMSLDEAMQLTEDHSLAVPGLGIPGLSQILSLLPSYPPVSPPQKLGAGAKKLTPSSHIAFPPLPL